MQPGGDVLFGITLAMASTPSAVIAPVEAIRSIQRFELDQPVRYTHTAAPREVRSGWLLELAVDPVLQRPHAISTPVLWVGQQVAVRVNWHSACAVVWVPDGPEPTKVPIFYGGVELPERLSAEDGAHWRNLATEVGVSPLVPEHVHPPLQLPSFTPLMREATRRARACETP